MRIISTLFLFFFSITVTSAQTFEHPRRTLEGYWTGALIRGGNSIQAIEAEIYVSGDSMIIESSIPDWVYYPPRTSRLDTSGNQLNFETYYGNAEMILDTVYMEMIGTVQEANPPYNFHLKKSLRPPSLAIGSQELEISNEGANISGTLYYPEYADKPLPCAIMVHGRGCNTRRSEAGRAKILVEYGMAAFVYDKRGSGPGGFPCDQSNHDLVVSDVLKIVEEVAKPERVDRDRIGLISYSAGGWIIPHVAAESEVPIAFLITLVGPTTSVKQQQLDGLEAFLRADGMGEEGIAEAKEYTELMFSKEDKKESFDRMQELLVSGDESGWTEWLVEDDYLDSPEDFETLWVQRFDYDPAEDLKSFENPYLAIFGEEDPVVPYKIQLEKLESLMAESGKTNYAAQVVWGGSHGLEHGHKLREVPSSKTFSPNYYLKFDRVGYGAVQYIIDFLEEYGFIEE